MNVIAKALRDRLLETPAIVAKLAAADGVYEDQAPQDAGTPFITVAHASSGPQDSLGDGIAWEETIYNVKAIVEGGSAKVAGELQQLIDEALTGTALTISGRQQILLRRVSGINYPENDNGRTWHHRGASYQIWFE